MSILYKKPILFVLWLFIVSFASSAVMLIVIRDSYPVTQQIPETYVVVGTEKATIKLGKLDVNKTVVKKNEEVGIAVDVTTTGEDVQSIMANITWNKDDFLYVAAEPQLSNVPSVLLSPEAGNAMLLHYQPEGNHINISANTSKRIFILKLKALKDYPTSQISLNTDNSSSVLFTGSSANGLDLAQSPDIIVQFSAPSATAVATATATTNPTATSAVSPTATAVNSGNSRTVKLQVLFKGVETTNVNFNSLVAIRTSPDLVTAEKVVLVNDKPVKFTSGGKPAGKDWVLFTSDPITVPTNGYVGKFDIRIKGIKHISHTFIRKDLADNIDLTDYAMEPGDITDAAGKIDNDIDTDDLKVLEDLIKSQPSASELQRADLNFDGALDIVDRALLRSGLRNQGQ